MHSHLLPGIDDGSPNIETSLKLIKGLQNLGFHSLITSPHVMTDLYPNTTEGIKAKEKEVKDALEKEGNKIPFVASAEYLMDEGFAEKVKERDFIPMRNQYVLFEMSFVSPSPVMHETVFKLRTKGYIPIFAHPERYPYLSNDLENYQQIIDMGCLLQGNILSFSGYYGKPVKEAVEALVKKDMLHMVGTDLHHERHLEALPAALNNKHLANLIQSGKLKNHELVEH
jgi:tyrosine-protein phosphatase YwqE